jgi:hypothetical protein
MPSLNMSSHGPYCVLDAQSAITAMSTSPSNRKAVTIAVSLLKRQDPTTIQTLKNLLTFIPNPNHVQRILVAAVIELVRTSPCSALWLFQHPKVLEPELHVREIIVQELTNKLCSWGYTLDDFHFTVDQRLETSEATRSSLLVYQPIPDDAAFLTLIQAFLR